MWYKFATQAPADVFNFMLDKREKDQFLNSPSKPKEEIQKDPAETVMEDKLDTERSNTDINPQKYNEARQPIMFKSDGQGGTALLQHNKDLPAYSDNFINTNWWNTQY